MVNQMNAFFFYAFLDLLKTHQVSNPVGVFF